MYPGWLEELSLGFQVLLLPEYAAVLKLGERTIDNRVRYSSYGERTGYNIVRYSSYGKEQAII